MKETLQQHVDTLDGLKEQIVRWAEDDFRSVLLDSNFTEIALSLDADQLKEFCRQLFIKLLLDNANLFAEAANSAQNHALGVVQKVS